MSSAEENKRSHDYQVSTVGNRTVASISGLW